MASFDQLATLYEPLERISFAGQLQRLRRFCLPHSEHCRHGLLIGDGDGRFSSEFLKTNRSVQLHSIDISLRMLEVAKARAGADSDRLTQHSIDARLYPYPQNTYDFIGLHFCLDCFSQQDVDALLPLLKDALKTGGIIAYSDFQAKSWWQAFLVRGLYLSFRLGAGLKTKKLPQVEWGSTFETVAEIQILGGLAFSRVLRKTSV